MIDRERAREVLAPYRQADVIVQRLADAAPLSAHRYRWRFPKTWHCGLCGSWGRDPDAIDHAPDCSWRLAVEWVAANILTSSPHGGTGTATRSSAARPRP